MRSNTWQPEDSEEDDDGGLTRKGPAPFGHISELGPIHYRERGQLEREFLQRMRRQHQQPEQQQDDHGWDPNSANWL